MSIWGYISIRHFICEKDYAWNISTCSCECARDCEISEYPKSWTCMKSLADDLVAACDKIVDIQISHKLVQQTK